MKYRQNNSIEAAAKASISRATAYRVEHDPDFPRKRRTALSAVAPIRSSMSSMPIEQERHHRCRGHC